MPTVVLEAPESLRLEERPEPTAGGEDVVVRIRATGICGTDISIFSGKVAVDYPLVLGHEMVGTLESSTLELAPGTRVVVDPNMFCGTCYQCLRGQENVCSRAELMGRDRDGARFRRSSTTESRLFCKCSRLVFTRSGRRRCSHRTR